MKKPIFFLFLASINFAVKSALDKSNDNLIAKIENASMICEDAGGEIKMVKHIIENHFRGAAISNILNEKEMDIINYIEELGIIKKLVVKYAEEENKKKFEQRIDTIIEKFKEKVWLKIMESFNKKHSQNQVDQYGASSSSSCHTKSGVELTDDEMHELMAAAVSIEEPNKEGVVKNAIDEVLALREPNENTTQNFKLTEKEMDLAKGIIMSLE